MGRSTPPAIQVSELELRVPVAPEGAAARLQVRRLRLRLSAAALARLLQPARVKLRLAPGGGAIEARVGPVRVNADLIASVTGEGRMRVDATALRVGGFLPLPPALVAGALAKAEVLPGVRALPPRSLELDPAALLEHLLRPLNGRVAVRLERLQVTGDFLEAECVPEEGF